jgi:hypothetical protein
MSRNEGWRTRAYWLDHCDGALYEEFPAIRSSKDCAKRLIDGLVLNGQPKEIKKFFQGMIKGADITVIQTKSIRLGMYLMGQAYFSREIMRRFEPRSIRTVAVCGKGDSEMKIICDQFDIGVWVCLDEMKRIYEERLNARPWQG